MNVKEAKKTLNKYDLKMDIKSVISRIKKTNCEEYYMENLICMTDYIRQADITILCKLAELKISKMEGQNGK